MRAHRHEASLGPDHGHGLHLLDGGLVDFGGHVQAEIGAHRLGREVKDLVAPVRPHVAPLGLHDRGVAREGRARRAPSGDDVVASHLVNLLGRAALGALRVLEGALRAFRVVIIGAGRLRFVTPGHGDARLVAVRRERGLFLRGNFGGFSCRRIRKLCDGCGEPNYNILDFGHFLDFGKLPFFLVVFAMWKLLVDQ